MMTEVAAAETRTATTSLQVKASPAAVWQALTDPIEIVRWFALSAEVEPGEGGQIIWAWHDVWTWPLRIALWEPNRHLRLAYELDPASGLKLPADPLESARPLIVDFQLEPKGEGTVLRLVHSGFGRDAAWDDEYEGVRRGWITELAALRHYLERHRGELRETTWVYARIAVTPAVAWSRLIGSATEVSPVIRTRNGLLAAIGGKRASLVLEGYEVGSHLIARIPSWGEAQLRMWVDPAGDDTLAQVFFAFHGDAAEGGGVPSVQELCDVVRRTFADASEVVAM